MAKLVLSSAGMVVDQCFLDDEPLNIGREASNHMVIDDPAVGREHAKIIRVGNDHIVEDLQSANGTSVNGTRVQRHILQHGDVLEFGAFHLRYLNPRASAETDLDRTMLITGLKTRVETDRDEPSEEVRVPAARPTRTRFPKGRVKVTRGPRAGSIIGLDRVVATFGQPGEQLAVLTRRPHGYFITHVEGRNFPSVNGRTIGRDALMLHNGDVIEVAAEKLEFVLD